jgi:hypothetical protein
LGAAANGVADGASREHALLFNEGYYPDGYVGHFDKFNPNIDDKVVGVQVWGNATRVQIQDVPEDYCFGNGTATAVGNRASRMPQK